MYVRPVKLCPVYYWKTVHKTVWVDNQSVRRMALSDLLNNSIQNRRKSKSFSEKMIINAGKNVTL